MRAKIASLNNCAVPFLTCVGTILLTTINGTLSNPRIKI